MEKESGKKFVENFNKAKLESNKFSLEHLLKLEKWAKKHEVPPATVMTDKQASLMNEYEKLLHEQYGLKVHTWKVGDKYYRLI